VQSAADLQVLLGSSAEGAFNREDSAEIEFADAEVVVSCERCAAAVPETSRYCGSCGAAVAARKKDSKTAPMGGFDVAVGQRCRLAVLNADGTLRRALVLADAPVTMGSAEAELLLERDPFVAQRHARVRKSDKHWVLEDLRTVNGVYLRIKGSATLGPGDYLRAGHQLFRVAAHAELFGKSPPPLPSAGVKFFGSPASPEPLYLCQLQENRRVGTILSLEPGARRVIGREHGDATWPSDDFMSTRHAQLENVRGKCVVTDLESTNGVFVRLTAPAPLFPGDVFCVGETLVRFELG
jgi:pSer/pThr/pTyr-binding forkhead associated (FHA) protein